MAEPGLNAGILGRVPTEKELSRLSMKIGKEFRFLAIELGVPNARVQQIILENQLSVSQQIFYVLLEWRRMNSTRATVAALADAMRNCEADVSVLTEVFQ